MWKCPVCSLNKEGDTPEKCPQCGASVKKVGLSAETKANLEAAFAGESQARNKYTFFAQVARNEGWLEVAEAFEEAAINEEQHAKLIFKLLQGIGDTKANLLAAIAGEDHEYQSMYPEFARIARELGDDNAAKYCEEVAKVEEHHSARFQGLLNQLEANTLLKKEQAINWKCRVCGYVYEGTEPPEVCPLCVHPKKHYEPMK